MERRKKLVIATATAAACFLCAGVVYRAIRPPEPIVFDTFGHPSIGNGSTELVVFEDLRCANCRLFMEQIFSQVMPSLIETGRARLTMVLVAFSEESKVFANAALSVYQMNPDRFAPFILELLRTQTEDKAGVLKAAQAVGGLDLVQLSLFVDQKTNYREIDQNLHFARSLIGADFGTPALFVNGIPTSTESFTKVVTRVEQIEKGK